VRIFKEGEFSMCRVHFKQIRLISCKNLANVIEGGGTGSSKDILVVGLELKGSKSPFLYSNI